MLDTYLQTEQAREDVRELLQRKTGSTWFGGLNQPTLLCTYECGAWVRVNAQQSAQEGMHAYYRLDGDRYVVTDLGEGVRALRLRTGICMLTLPQVCEVFDRTPEMLGVHFGADSALYATEGNKASVTAADLPDAICRVMLASLRVAQS